MKRRSTLFIGLLLGLGLLAAAAGRAQAQSISYELAPRTLRVGESATATFTIDTTDALPAPTFAPVHGIKFAYIGKEQKQFIDLTRGQLEGSITHRYRIVPLQSGTYRIAPNPYHMGGKIHTFPPIELKVLGRDEPATDTSKTWHRMLTDHPETPLYWHGLRRLQFFLKNRGYHPDRPYSRVT